MRIFIPLLMLSASLLASFNLSCAQGVFTSSAQLSSNQSGEIDTVRSTGNHSFPVTYLDKTPDQLERPAPGLSEPNSVSMSIDPVKDSLQFLRYIDSLATLRVASLRANESERALSNSGLDRSLNRLRDIPSILPFYVAPDKITGLVKTRMSSGFGMRQHPVLGSLMSHTGIDLSAPMGTYVYATADGFCQQIINQPNGIGLGIYLAHGRGHQTLYGHLLSSQVKPGDFVYRGQVIGRVGASGMTTGPHLHYGVRYKGEVVDPLPYCFLLSKPFPVKPSATLSRN